MLSTLRIVAVVGVIFYLSPLRQEGTLKGVEHVAAWGKGLLAPSREPSAAERIEELWKALPPEARKAAIEKMLAEAARPLHPETEDAPGHHEPRPPRPGEAKKAKP